MYLARLHLERFRNIVSRDLEFSPGVNLFLGENGQGKTNLLESVYLLSFIRSFRTSKLRELISWDETEATVHGLLQDRLGSLDIRLLFSDRERLLNINGEFIRSASAILGKVLCVGFSPADIALVKGPPAERRKFLDKHLVNLKPEILPSLVNYHRSLKHKAALLKQDTCNSTVLEPWNRILALETAKIDMAKRAFVESLNDRAREIHKEFAGVTEVLDIRLVRGIQEWQTVDDLLQQYANYQRREMLSRTSLLGPHRDDFIVTLNGKDARAFASQGQSRSVVLSLKLAVIELLERHRRDSPIVLLDDVDSELDQRRGDAFFEMILSQNRQAFITGTTTYSGVLTRRSERAMFTVQGGSIKPRVRTG